MAASFDGTRITDADALTEATYTAGLWEDIGGGAATLETDFFYQGSYSVSEQAKGSENGTCFIPTSVTFNASGSNYLFLLKGLVTTSGLLATTRATGQKFEIGSGATSGSGQPTNYYQYYTYYSATYPPKESFIIHLFDVQEIGYIDNHAGGSVSNAAINYWGHVATMTGSVKSNNVSMDAIEYVVNGQGMTWTGTGGTFQAFVDLDEGTVANRWGVVTTREGVIYCLAVLSLSDTSATTFVASNQKIIFPWTYAAEGAQGIDVDLSNSSTEVALNVCSFTGKGTGAVKKWFDTTLDIDANMDTIMIPSHRMETGDHVLYSREGGSSDIGPEPSVEGTTDHWAIAVDDNHIALATSKVNAYADTRQALNTATSENHSIVKNPDNRIDFTASGTSGSLALDSCILEGVRILTLTSAVDIASGFIQSIGNIVASTGVLTGVKISEATLEEGVALFTPLANLTNVTDCEFVAPATVTSDVAALAWQVDATGPAYSDQTVDLKDFGTGQLADVNMFPATPASGDYFAIGFQRPFDKLILNNAGGTAGVGSGLTLTWEYSTTGTTWTALSGVSDGTSSLTAAVSDGQVVTWTMPTDWVATPINSTATLYYIRAYITAGTYSTNPVYDNGWVEGDNLQQHGHAVEITSAGSFNSSGNLFTGYWTPEISGTSNGWEFDTETGVNGTTEVITTDAKHGLYSGDAVYYNNEGGTETPGPTNGNKYYAHVLSDSTLKLHSTRTGSIVDNSSTRVNLTASGGGSGETHAIYGSHAVVFNDSAGSVTINATNNGDVPSYRNGTSADTTATAAVTIEITGVTEGARCVIRSLASVELLNDLAFTSDGAGAFKASTGFAYTGDVDVYVSAASSGKVQAGVSDDTAVFTDETRQANDSRTGAGNTMTLIPTATPATPDGFYFGHTEQFLQMDLDVLTAGTGTYTIAWEYWNGATWATLPGISDGTSNYKNAGSNRISWTTPTGWATTTVGNQPGTTALYYVRGRFVSGTVTITPVGRSVVLDVTKYIRWEDTNKIVSTGLSVKAAWAEDTTAEF